MGPTLTILAILGVLHHEKPTRAQPNLHARTKFLGVEWTPDDVVGSSLERCRRAARRHENHRDKIAGGALLDRPAHLGATFQTSVDDHGFRTLACQLLEDVLGAADGRNAVSR